MLPQLKNRHWTITCLQLCRKDRKYVLKRIQHNSGIRFNQLQRLLVYYTFALVKTHISPKDKTILAKYYTIRKEQP